MTPTSAAIKVQKQNLDGFPYHPIAYHLDLCILSYHLYNQSLTWPCDPYYEDLNNFDWDRKNFMTKVRDWVKVKGADQLTNKSGLDSYRGPGILGGFADNPNHDPIIYRYDSLHPWSSSISKPQSRWVEYLTPDLLTSQIQNVYVSYRKTGQAEGTVALDQIVPKQVDSASGARDVILAFEGGTGDKGLAGQPASQSLMGFVLMRFKENSEAYDIHIVFRGSRSGSAGRAMAGALSSDSASGNPDWITDMGYDIIGPSEGAGPITTIGKVSRGFARSVSSAFPQLFRCLGEVSKFSSNRNPDRIFVSGHSLGGGLAQHFVSAILMGNQYGPNGTGNSMPVSLTSWPWKQIKLVTFGGPRSGDETWAKQLTETGLSSDFFSTLIDPLDRNYLVITDPSIISRMTDKDKPAGFRVLISNDPITTGKISGGKHVGKTVYLDKVGRKFYDTPKTPDPESHEPYKVRELMLASLSDDRIPPIAWKYHQLAELTPQRNDKAKGTLVEYKKLEASIKNYYQNKNLWFNESDFESDAELFDSML